jgi:hypothetical protein
MKNVKLMVLAVVIFGFGGCEFRGADACAVDRDCEEGQVCDTSPTPNACIPDPNKCQSDSDCTAPGFEVCNTEASPTYCTQCLEDAHCNEAAGETCNLATELCEEPAQSECDPDGNCPEGLICNTDLDPDQCVSTPGGDGDPCDADNDCASGDCQIDPNVGGTCTAPELPECTTDDDCEIGSCINNTCQIDCNFDHVLIQPGKACWGELGWLGVAENSDNVELRGNGFAGFLGGDQANPNNGYDPASAKPMDHEVIGGQEYFCADVPVNTTGSRKIIHATPFNNTAGFFNSADTCIVESADEDLTSYLFTSLRYDTDGATREGLCIDPNSPIWQVYDAQGKTNGVTLVGANLDPNGNAPVTFVFVLDPGSNTLEPIGNGDLELQLGCDI